MREEPEGLRQRLVARGGGGDPGGRAGPSAPAAAARASASVAENGISIGDLYSAAGREGQRKAMAEGVEQVPREPSGTDCLGQPHAPVRPAVYGRAEARPVTGKVAAVYNPRSGKRRGQRAAEELRDLLAGMDGPPVELHATQYAFHAAELVRGLELGPGDLVVAVGGDGTLSEVITGLMERAGDGPRVPVAVLPAGTGNCMAVDLGFRTVRQVAEAIVRGTFTDVDLCEASYVKGLPGSEQAAKGERATTYICNMMGYGLGVDANIAAEKLRWLGPLRYDVGILQEIIKAKQRKTRFTADGTAFALDVSMALLLNNQCTGKNLPLAPFSQLDDGKIDFLLLENKSRLETLKLFNACKAQGRHVFAKSGVHYLRVKESLTIETDAPEAINIDGENVGSTPFSMKFLPGAIPLLLPGPAAAPAGGGDRL